MDMNKYERDTLFFKDLVGSVFGVNGGQIIVE
jgi:hypothetical protein